jgi:hypothetical protein
MGIAGGLKNLRNMPSRHISLLGAQKKSTARFFIDNFNAAYRSPFLFKNCSRLSTG